MTMHALVIHTEERFSEVGESAASWFSFAFCENRLVSVAQNIEQLECEPISNGQLRETAPPL